MDQYHSALSQYAAPCYFVLQCRPCTLWYHAGPTSLWLDVVLCAASTLRLGVVRGSILAHAEVLCSPTCACLVGDGKKCVFVARQAAAGRRRRPVGPTPGQFAGRRRAVCAVLTSERGGTLAGTPGGGPVPSAGNTADSREYRRAARLLEGAQTSYTTCSQQGHTGSCSVPHSAGVPEPLQTPLRGE